MKQRNTTSERVACQIKRTLPGNGAGPRPVTGAAVRSAALRAVRGTRLVGRGASNLAREAVEGAVNAVSEVGGETGSFVKDAVIGVVEGTGQVVTVTTPAVREVVVGAIRGSRSIGAEVTEIGRDAVDGAIVGAASVGVDSVDAASAAVDGAIEAVVEAGGNLEDAARATVGGVVSGVAAAGGDVAAATRDAAYRLISHDVAAERSITEIADAATGAIDAALQQAEGTDIKAEEVIAAAAIGVVEAAYEVDQTHGNRIRRSVIRRVLEPGLAVAPGLERRLADIADQLSAELPRGRAAWRGRSLVEAGRLVVRAGGIDMAASLSFFTILSLLPLVALAIMVMAFFGDPEGFGEELTEVLVYYFPTSRELIEEAVSGLLRGSLAIGLVALASIILGANGLFMAANRGINRVFGIEAKNVIHTTVSEVSIATLVVILFLMSIGVTGFLHVAVSFSEGIGRSSGGFSAVVVFALGVVSAVLPMLLTAVVFVFVYQRLPNARVEWKDAAFGAMVAIALFEIGKHLFFWFTNLAAQRSAVYGPIASVVVLMTWGYIAGMIFLYGAALVKCAGDLRPTRKTHSMNYANS